MGAFLETVVLSQYCMNHLEAVRDLLYSRKLALQCGPSLEGRLLVQLADAVRGIV